MADEDYKQVKNIEEQKCMHDAINVETIKKFFERDQIFCCGENEHSVSLRT